MMKYSGGKKARIKTGRGIRQRGLSYERQVVQELRAMGFDAHTSRYVNKKRDDEGVDIVTDAPLNIQCKCANVFKNPVPIIEDMPDDGDMNVVFNKVVGKMELVVLSTKDFYKLLTFATKKTILKRQHTV